MWITEFGRGRRFAASVLCIPFAGAGAGAYEMWGRGGTELRVGAACLPGRERRFREPLLRKLDAVVDALAEEAACWLAPPSVVFGHSVGALIAWALCVELRRRNLRGPDLLIVSGRVAPGESTGPRLHDLLDREIVESLRGLGGIPDELLRDRAALATFLPAIRADLEINESPSCRPCGELSTPIAVFCGRSDADFGSQHAAAWAAATTGACSVHEFTGGHFYVWDQPALVLSRISEILRGSSGVVAAPPELVA